MVTLSEQFKQRTEQAKSFIPLGATASKRDAILKSQQEAQQQQTQQQVEQQNQTLLENTTENPLTSESYEQRYNQIDNNLQQYFISPSEFSSKYGEQLKQEQQQQSYNERYNQAVAIANEDIRRGRVAGYPNKDKVAPEFRAMYVQMLDTASSRSVYESKVATDPIYQVFVQDPAKANVLKDMQRQGAKIEIKNTDATSKGISVSLPQTEQPIIFETKVSQDYLLSKAVELNSKGEIVKVKDPQLYSKIEGRSLGYVYTSAEEKQRIIDEKNKQAYSYIREERYGRIKTPEKLNVYINTSPEGLKEQVAVKGAVSLYDYYNSDNYITDIQSKEPTFIERYNEAMPKQSELGSVSWKRPLRSTRNIIQNTLSYTYADKNFVINEASRLLSKVPYEQTTMLFTRRDKVSSYIDEYGKEQPIVPMDFETAYGNEISQKRTQVTQQVRESAPVFLNELLYTTTPLKFSSGLLAGEMFTDVGTDWGRNKTMREGKMLADSLGAKEQVGTGIVVSAKFLLMGLSFNTYINSVRASQFQQLKEIEPEYSITNIKKVKVMDKSRELIAGKTVTAPNTAKGVKISSKVNGYQEVWKSYKEGTMTYEMLGKETRSPANIYEGVLVAERRLNTFVPNRPLIANTEGRVLLVKTPKGFNVVGGDKGFYNMINGRGFSTVRYPSSTLGFGKYITKKDVFKFEGFGFDTTARRVKTDSNYQVKMELEGLRYNQNLKTSIKGNPRITSVEDINSKVFAGKLKIKSVTGKEIDTREFVNILASKNKNTALLKTNSITNIKETFTTKEPLGARTLRTGQANPKTFKDVVVNFLSGKRAERYFSSMNENIDNQIFQAEVNAERRRFNIFPSNKRSQVSLNPFGSTPSTPPTPIPQTKVTVPDNSLIASGVGEQLLQSSIERLTPTQFLRPVYVSLNSFENRQRQVPIQKNLVLQKLDSREKLKITSPLKESILYKTKFDTVQGTAQAQRFTPIEQQIPKQIQVPLESITTYTPNIPKIPIAPVVPFGLPFMLGKQGLKNKLKKNKKTAIGYSSDFTSSAVGLPEKFIKEKDINKLVRNVQTGLEVRQIVRIK